jgi:hypothetical protein
MNKIIQLILLILFATGCLGQTIITGRLRDYHTKEILSFVLITEDSISFFKQRNDLLLAYTTYSDSNGSFMITLNGSGQANLTFSFVGYVSLTIKNIKIISNNKQLDLGDVYLPFRGDFYEGYRFKGRLNRRKARTLNWSGLDNDFLAPFRGKETALIEYPPSGSKRLFRIKEDTLIIDFEEFIKK